MFTQKISMHCTEEQYKKYLKDELLKMGYKEISINNWHCQKYQYICNNYEDANGSLGTIHRDGLKRYNRTYLGSFNAPLFLALAAMTTSKTTLGDGEYVTNEKNGSLYRNDWGNQPFNHQGCHKSTVREIRAKFNETKTNTNITICDNIHQSAKKAAEQENAIKLLKENGYKILKPTSWEEV